MRTLAILALVALTGCANAAYTDPEYCEQDRLDRYRVLEQRHFPSMKLNGVIVTDKEEAFKFLDVFCAQLKKPGARIGQSAQHVIEKTNWGKPDYINTTITARGKTEQWVYEDYGYLYFVNGKLVAIQD